MPIKWAFVVKPNTAFGTSISVLFGVFLGNMSTQVSVSGKNLSAITANERLGLFVCGCWILTEKNQTLDLKIILLVDSKVIIECMNFVCA